SLCRAALRNVVTSSVSVDISGFAVRATHKDDILVVLQGFSDRETQATSFNQDSTVGHCPRMRIWCVRKDHLKNDALNGSTSASHGNDVSFHHFDTALVFHGTIPPPAAGETGTAPGNGEKSGATSARDCGAGCAGLARTGRLAPRRTPSMHPWMAPPP